MFKTVAQCTIYFSVPWIKMARNSYLMETTLCLKWHAEFDFVRLISAFLHGDQNM